jgi:hypothetical protein
MIDRQTFVRAAVMAALLMVGCHRVAPSSMPIHGSGYDGHTSGTEPHAGHDVMQGFSKLVLQSDGEPKAGSDTTLTLRVDGANGTTVKDFEVIHDHKAHLIAVTKGLDQFAHIHPTIQVDGTMTVTYRFPVGGHYWLYLDHKPAGKPQSTAFAEMQVGGATVAAPELRPNVPGSVQVNGLKADISVSGSGSASTQIVFKLTDSTDQPVTNLEPYMGAMGHLVVISADGKEYVHAHMEGAKAESGAMTFQAHFMRSGLFKGWGQFQRGGQVLVVPFVMRNGG